MASPPFDLNKFDLNDPETRKWVESNFKMDDPETQKHLETLTTSKEIGDGVIDPTTGAQSFYPKPGAGKKSILGTPLNEEPWGIKLEDKQFIQGDTTPYQELGKGNIPGAVTSMLRHAAGDVVDYGAVPFQALGRGTEALADSADELSDATGLADALSWEGNKFHPGSAVMRLLEAFPELGSSHGMEAPAMAGKFRTPKGDVAAPDLRARLNAEADDLFSNGASLDELQEWAKKNGMSPFGDDLKKRIESRDREATPATPQFTRAEQTELPLEEQGNLPFNRPTREEANLKAQADEFTANKAEEPDLDFRQRELPLEKPAEQLRLDLNEPVAKPVHIDETTPPSDHVNKLVEQVGEIVSDWKGLDTKPGESKFLVHESFDNLDGVDPDAVGATMPDGKIYINASKVDTPDKLSAVVFHEALGHNGMTKLLGDKLDSTLTDFYNTNDNFRADVDRWMGENPTAYTGEGSVARAADEVLAEMSEKGKIDPTLLNQLKNQIKEIGRKIGIKLKYSDREIETILGMAHDAVVKGKKSVADNGFSMPRYMAEESDRRSKIKAATARLDETKKGETKTTQPFPDEEPDYWRFRHVTDDGKEISGFYNVEDGKLQDFNINSKAGPGEFGPRVVRKVARDLLKVHPEVKSIGGYRISGARIKGTGKSPFDAQFVESGARFMRDRKKFLTTDKVETPRDVSDLLDYTADELEKSHTTVPDEEIRHIAEALNLSPKAYLDSQGFVDKKLAARILAGKQIFTNMSHDIEGLAEKLRAKWSPDLHAEIRQKLAVQQAIAARLDKDTAEVGRALRVQREITKARQSPKDLLRYMAQHGDDTLSTPEGMNKFLEGYEKIGQNSGPEAKVGYLRDATKTGGSIITDLLNVPRTFKSSFDLSAPFRQGLFLAGKKDFWKALPDMVKALVSDEARIKVTDAIRSHENYPLMLKGNLSLTGDFRDLTAREEMFMSRLAGKLPGIKHSERAYSTFLDKLRSDVFNDMIRQAQEGGIDFTLDEKGRFSDPKSAKTLKDISTFVNNATGRGDLGGLNGSAATLANVFFSPRLTASRINMFAYALKPSTYTKLSPVVRKEILKSYLTLGGSAAMLYTLAKAGGADVETNPRSSDFGKIKVGNTRYGTDLSPYITLAARLATNETKPLAGEQHELGSKYGGKDAWDLITTFARNKLAPIPGTAVDVRTGKNVVGEEVTPGSAASQLFVPMFMSDLNDIRKDQDGDIAKAMAMSIPGLIGFSAQTFDETKKPDGTPK